MVDKSYQQKQKEVINYKGVNMDGVGTFQLCTTMTKDGNRVFETIMDTRTGEVISRITYGEYVSGSDHPSEKYITPSW